MTQAGFAAHAGKVGHGNGESRKRGQRAFVAERGQHASSDDIIRQPESKSSVFGLFFEGCGRASYFPLSFRPGVAQGFAIGVVLTDSAWLKPPNSATRSPFSSRTVESALLRRPSCERPAIMRAASSKCFPPFLRFASVVPRSVGLHLSRRPCKTYPGRYCHGCPRRRGLSLLFREGTFPVLHREFPCSGFDASPLRCSGFQGVLATTTLVFGVSLQKSVLAANLDQGPFEAWSDRGVVCSHRTLCGVDPDGRYVQERPPVSGSCPAGTVDPGRGLAGPLNWNVRLQAMRERIALITGVTGQDGAYLAEYLLSLGYVVHGIKRRSSSFNTARVDHLYQDPHVGNVPFLMHYGDMTDSTNLIRLVQQIRPTEIYNLAAQSHVAVSFESPEYTANADAIGVLRLLEAIRILGMEKDTRFYQASTSELYGLVQEIPQKETTPFYPRSPYGVAKLYGYWITVNYREAYGMFASNGILFNHESPIRGETFVTRKITRAVARIEVGLEDTLYLGNLSAKRDWGHARDYVEGMHKILQADKPDDFVLATGEMRSVREMVELSFAQVGRRIAWRGAGVDETGIDARSGKTVVRIDPTYFRPTEVDLLVGDASKAREVLGWTPKRSFAQLVEEMVASDLAEAKRDAGRGKRTL